MSAEQELSAEPELLPGTIQAVRAWDLVPELGTGRVLLGAIAQCAIWPAGPVSAECLSVTHIGEGPAPGPGCNCGIYAYHRHEVEGEFLSIHAELDEVVGVIDAWGRIEVHESGIRAQHARVSALLVDSSAPEGHRRQAGRAAATYGVELECLPPDQFPRYLRERVRGLDEAYIERLLLHGRRLVLEPRTVGYTSRRGEAVGGFGFVDVAEGLAPRRFQKRLQLGSLAGTVVRVAGAAHHGEALQSDAFAPGAEVTLLAEPQNPHDPNAISVWDAECATKLGYLPRELAPEVGARLAAGRIKATRSIWEWRDMRSGRRTGLHVLLAATSEVEFAGGEQLPIG